MTRIDKLRKRRRSERIDRNVVILKLCIVIAVTYFICQAVATIH
ncbi:hypothetical protein [Companilactobacillus bobalius]|nr:hypothetical protein [Companilactobacillus bobalius]GEO57483.1 hypothetical protein LBO01_06120 [Companilactobacillus paralimentarius]